MRHPSLKINEINSDFFSKCKEWGLRLKTIRTEKKLSIEFVHEKTGVSRDAICRVENAKSQYHPCKIAEPSIYTIFKLATFYNVPFQEILI